jgi:hypothetical protein
VRRGEGTNGRLGYGSTVDVGGLGPVSDADDVPVFASGTVKIVAAGAMHTCDIVTDGSVWYVVAFVCASCLWRMCVLSTL